MEEVTTTVGDHLIVVVLVISGIKDVVVGPVVLMVHNQMCVRDSMNVI